MQNRTKNFEVPAKIGQILAVLRVWSHWLQKVAIFTPKGKSFARPCNDFSVVLRRVRICLRIIIIICVNPHRLSHLGSKLVGCGKIKKFTETPIGKTRGVARNLFWGV